MPHVNRLDEGCEHTQQTYHNFLYPQFNKAVKKTKQTTIQLNNNNKMALFLPSNLQPLAPAADIESWDDKSMMGLENADFFKTPKGLENRSVPLDYTQL